VSEAQQREFLERALAPLIADVRRTLDPEFEVDLFIEDGWWMWSASGSTASISGTEWDPKGAPEDGLASLTAQLADQLPDFAFDEIQREWPRCPRHEDHPLYAEARHEQALWVCRKSGGVAICEIGCFGEAAN
jgi:hypothetical protein